ncbi:MAG: hypothetical protein SGI92_22250 [Bryobacteraceae bacterium]|nr:hypothetical protein [Bryobacteraceae bacterium]
MRRSQRTRSAVAREEARKVAGGLLRLASAGSTPGFVARRAVADGKTHYAAGSDDQTFPWFYGLWHYARSP